MLLAAMLIMANGCKPSQTDRCWTIKVWLIADTAEALARFRDSPGEPVFTFSHCEKAGAEEARPDARILASAAPPDTVSSAIQVSAGH